jgi:hypothetical protein
LKLILDFIDYGFDVTADCRHLPPLAAGFALGVVAHM